MKLNMKIKLLLLIIVFLCSLIMLPKIWIFGKNNNFLDLLSLIIPNVVIILVLIFRPWREKLFGKNVNHNFKIGFISLIVLILLNNFAEISQRFNLFSNGISKFCSTLYYIIVFIMVYFFMKFVRSRGH